MTLAVTGSTGFVALAQRAVIKHERTSGPPPTALDSVGQWHFGWLFTAGRRGFRSFGGLLYLRSTMCVYGCWSIALAVAVVMGDRRVWVRSIRFLTAGTGARAMCSPVSLRATAATVT